MYVVTLHAPRQNKVQRLLKRNRNVIFTGANITYTVYFNFHVSPPYEIPTNSENVDFSLGQVAFEISNVDCNEEESVNEFLKVFSCKKLYLDGKPVSKKMAPVILPSEQEYMRSFIETVLLVPAPEQWTNKIPPSRRLPVFLMLHPNNEEFIFHFENITRRPAVTCRPKAWYGFNPEKKWEEIGERFKKNIQEWKEAWENRDKFPGVLRQVISKWETAAWRYDTEDLLAIAWLELYSMAERNITVKQCRKCKKYFVPWPANTLYCPACRKDYTRQEIYREKQKENMSEEKKQEDRRWRTNYMRKYRLLHSLANEGKSVKDISEVTDWEPKQVAKLLKKKVSKK